MAASLPEETIRLYKNVMNDVVNALREDLKAQQRYETAEIEKKLDLLRSRWRAKLLEKGVDLDAVLVPTATGALHVAAAPKRKKVSSSPFSLTTASLTDDGHRKRVNKRQPKATQWLPPGSLAENGGLTHDDNEDDEDDEDEDDEEDGEEVTPNTREPIATRRKAAAAATSAPPAAAAVAATPAHVGVSLDTPVPSQFPSSAVPTVRAVPAPGAIHNPYAETARRPGTAPSAAGPPVQRNAPTALSSLPASSSAGVIPTARRPTQPAPPQFDGPGDEKKRGGAAKKAGAKSKGKTKAEAKKDSKATILDEDEAAATAIDLAPEANEDPLGSGDDDTDDDIPPTDNLILCQYEKIHHVKDKWKLQLSDGIMHINNQDYVFRRATADNIRW